MLLNASKEFSCVFQRLRYTVLPRSLHTVDLCRSIVCSVRWRYSSTSTQANGNQTTTTSNSSSSNNHSGDDGATQHAAWPMLRAGIVATTVMLATGGGWLLYNQRNNGTLMAATRISLPFSSAEPPAAAAVAAGGGAAAAATDNTARHKTNSSSSSSVANSSVPSAGATRTDLPRYTVQQVAEHNSAERRVWVTYGDCVYDVTEFVDRHPGGRSLLLAAGAAVDPFWHLYAVHKQPHVLRLLERFLIGRLADSGAAETSGGGGGGDGAGLWADEPHRHAALHVNSTTPFNAEPPAQLLVASYYTPTELFYVRNHLPVPLVDAGQFRLEIDCRTPTAADGDGDEEGGGEGVLSLSLDQLRSRYRLVTLDAALMCGGNRRDEMARTGGATGSGEPRVVRGLSWGAGAVGNASWTGVPLWQVLHSAGCTLESARRRGLRHVCFEGLDTDATGQPYGASIPIEHALDPRADVLLALDMNGRSLSRDHGFPVRALVPGVVGARSVKWLSRVYLSAEESPSHWQRRDYKGFCPSTDSHSADYDTAASIQQMPVTSAICLPSAPPGGTSGATVVNVSVHKRQSVGNKMAAAAAASDTMAAAAVASGDEVVQCAGYAWSGGGRRIVRVDVSSDGGVTWWPAQELQQQSTGDNLTTTGLASSSSSSGSGGASGSSGDTGNGMVPSTSGSGSVRQWPEVGRHWSWTLWRAEVPVQAPSGGETAQLCVKAIDECYNTQPEQFESIWNFRGLLSNAYHRVNVHLCRK